MYMYIIFYLIFFYFYTLYCNAYIVYPKNKNIDDNKKIINNNNDDEKSGNNNNNDDDEYSINIEHAKKTNVYPEFDNVYWSYITIGENKNSQNFSVVLDTGSSSLALPCSNCLEDDCGIKHKKYNINNYSTSRRKTFRKYEQCYTEGSCNYGEYISDLICINYNNFYECSKKNGIRYEFGCCSSYSNFFKNQEADGIIGLSKHPTSFISSYLGNIINYNKKLYPSFLLCLNKNFKSFLKIGNSYGHMKILYKKIFDFLNFLPLNNNEINLKSLIKIPSLFLMDDDIQFYKIEITKIELYKSLSTIIKKNDDDDNNNKDIKKLFLSDNKNNKFKINAIIDSGTTFTYIPNFIFYKLKELFIEWCNEDLKNRCNGIINPDWVYGEDKKSLGCFSPYYIINENERRRRMSFFNDDNKKLNGFSNFFEDDNDDNNLLNKYEMKKNIFKKISLKTFFSSFPIFSLRSKKINIDNINNISLKLNMTTKKLSSSSSSNNNNNKWIYNKIFNSNNNEDNNNNIQNEPIIISNPEKYFYKSNKKGYEKDTYCLGIFVNELNSILLGSHILSGNGVLFDRDKNTLILTHNLCLK